MRGAGEKGFHCQLKAIINCCSLDFIFVNLKELKNLLKLLIVQSFVKIPPKRLSGGMWFLWKPSYFSFQILCTSN